MLEEVEHWLTRRSWSVADRPLDRLMVAKAARGTTVSVVLPALNEEETVGEIVSVIRRELMERVRLVDELVVVDSGSTDRTAAVAAAAGARVEDRDAILPRLPALPGKGEVLWRSLLVTSGDVVCFVDADLRRFSADFVSGIVGPLLTDQDMQFVKAMYDRPLLQPAAGHPDDRSARDDRDDGSDRGDGDDGSDRGDRGGQGSLGGQGGRVTELVARPLLNLHWPRLAGFVQPLGGEYAARRSLLERLPFPVGYGVELGLLVDALHTAGLDALGQVDVGVRIHRHQDERALGRMAAAIYRTAQLRLSRAHLVRPELTQFERGENGFVPRTHAVDTEERPPVREIAEYTAGRAA
ncbi:glucosyl-3-phosphoglycerate synthase [Streptomyces sp. NPDC059896]|uniref:glucosyl-3-phosphoglycerate synthase n=1 Tax=Streptomyces sp. NPDC059896 TaxID=3346993 RepID=UPI003665CC15